MYVRIFHNASRDPVGRNLGFFGYKPEHPMVLVFAYPGRVADNDNALDDAFHEFNVGQGPLAQAYRGRKLRSLSVGDVVAIDETYYACADFGWVRLDTSVVLATLKQRSNLHGSTALDAA